MKKIILFLAGMLIGFVAFCQQTKLRSDIFIVRGVSDTCWIKVRSTETSIEPLSDTLKIVGFLKLDSNKTDYSTNYVLVIDTATGLVGIQLKDSVGSLINGTTEGQMLYWNNSLSKWDTTNIFFTWDNSTSQLIYGADNPYSFGSSNLIIGAGDTNTSNYSFLLGAYNKNYSDMSVILGQYITNNGAKNFIQGENHNDSAENSVILGGKYNSLKPNAKYSTIIGGHHITGTDSNTVYVPNLDVKNYAKLRTLTYKNSDTIVVMYNDTLWYLLKDSLINQYLPTGLTEGQMLYWNSVLSKWDTIQNSQMIWSDSSYTDLNFSQLNLKSMYYQQVPTDDAIRVAFSIYDSSSSNILFSIVNINQKHCNIYSNTEDSLLTVGGGASFTGGMRIDNGLVVKNLTLKNTDTVCVMRGDTIGYILASNIDVDTSEYSYNSDKLDGVELATILDTVKETCYDTIHASVVVGCSDLKLGASGSDVEVLGDTFKCGLLSSTDDVTTSGDMECSNLTVNDDVTVTGECDVLNLTATNNVTATTSFTLGATTMTGTNGFATALGQLPVTTNIGIIDTAVFADNTGNDSLLIFDDGDTSRITSDNPIKIGNGSLVVETDGDVKISGTITGNGYGLTGFTGITPILLSSKMEATIEGGNAAYVCPTTLNNDFGIELQIPSGINNNAIHIDSIVMTFKTDLNAAYFNSVILMQYSNGTGFPGIIDTYGTDIGNGNTSLYSNLKIFDDLDLTMSKNYFLWFDVTGATNYNQQKIFGGIIYWSF